MSSFGRWFSTAAAIALFADLGAAQVGEMTYPANTDSPLLCQTTDAGTPLLRPEGYTELLGDILINCTGGPLSQVGSMVPTANIVVYLLPSVPVTSRILGDNGASEALLIIDEPGTGLPTGAMGGYGPNAPQSLCTTVQQQNYPNPCQAAVSTDKTGQYQVTVAPGTSTPAQNIYQGKIGDFGPNSITFYNVPILPPAYTGVSRVFRITNLRVPVAGESLTDGVQVFVSASPGTALPLEGSYWAIIAGEVGSPMTASVNAAPAGGGNPFLACMTQASPALAAHIAFTDGFASGFKTRVVPGGNASYIYGYNPLPANNPNYPYAAEAQNLAAPFAQNIPGGLYGGLAQNDESGFILPAANTTVSDITYTAGLMDYGTRLKAVFTNIPAGVVLYVSTANAAGYSVPGGTSISPYAVLVATSQNKEANNDGAAFTPLTSALTGSDGLNAYTLTPDNSGQATAIWEVLNSSPVKVDVLTFSVYISYASTPGTASPTYAALSMAPEPGGGTFSTVNETQGLTSPQPRFAVVSAQGGPWATINACSLNAASTPLTFTYQSGGSLPPSQLRYVSFSPGNLPVSAAAVVTTPSGGNWLSASLSGGTLTVSVNPAGLSASATAYTGSVKLSAPGLNDVLIPVTFTVAFQAALSVSKTHTGNFTPGQPGAAYTITVSNSSGSTSGTVTVTEQAAAGLTLVSMGGNGWDCSTLPYCTRSDSLASGYSWAPITATVNVAANPPPRVANQVTVSGGGSANATAYDIAVTGPLTCTVTGDPVAGNADVQLMINQALGLAPPADDLNGDGVINILDVQIVVNAALGKGCLL
jgi:uncharacterized repeat protein (TIGR01451 family)